MTERDEEWLSRTLSAGGETDGAADAGGLLAGVRQRRRAVRRRRVAAVGATAVVTAAVVVVALAVRGGPDTASDPAAGYPEAATPYDGPLSGVDGTYGAAGEVVACEPVEGGSEPDSPYAEGATSDSVGGALETAYSEGLFLSVPDVDLAVAKVEGDRVLLTFAPGRRPVVALVFRDGPATEGAGGPGWYLESWARCDFADFPEQVAADFGYLLWRDAAGEPVPVRQVSSGPGAEHCGYDVMTFLYLRGGRDIYVRAPIRSLRDMVDEYRPDVPLPADAVATGFQREGERLWVSPDRRYVYVGRPGSVEAWPRFDIGCE